MVAVGDVMRFKMCGELFSQQICNLFYYVVGKWTGNLDLDDVSVVFSEDVMQKMADFQTEDLLWNRVIIDDVTNGIDFSDLTYAILGAITTSPALPSYVAASVTLHRTTRLTREGGKRIPGITEDQVLDNDMVTNAPRDVSWIDACTTDLRDLPVAIDFRFDPVIVGRLPGGGLDLTRVNPISSATVSSLVSTQNTRKQRLG